MKLQNHAFLFVPYPSPSHKTLDSQLPSSPSLPKEAPQVLMHGFPVRDAGRGTRKRGGTCSCNTELTDVHTVISPLIACDPAVVGPFPPFFHLSPGSNCFCSSWAFVGPPSPFFGGRPGLVVCVAGARSPSTNPQGCSVGASPPERVP